MSYQYKEDVTNTELTKRETEVLGYLYGELSQKEISVKIGCTTRTVKQHCCNIYEKLDIKDRIALMANKIKELNDTNS